MATLLQRPHRGTTLLSFGIALVALYGGSLPNDFTGEWYRALIRPDILPRPVERAIPFIWTGLFLLAGVALASVLASPQPRGWKIVAIALFIVQLGLNYSYSYVFTMMRVLPNAFWIAVALATVTALLIAWLLRGRAYLAAACITPYLLWVSFATYVTWELARLNPALS